MGMVRLFWGKIDHEMGMDGTGWGKMKGGLQLDKEVAKK
jgi:hypothetical protein